MPDDRPKPGLHPTEGREFRNPSPSVGNAHTCRVVTVQAVVEVITGENGQKGMMYAVPVASVVRSLADYEVIAGVVASPRHRRPARVDVGEATPKAATAPTAAAPTAPTFSVNGKEVTSADAMASFDTSQVSEDYLRACCRVLGATSSEVAGKGRAGLVALLGNMRAVAAPAPTKAAPKAVRTPRPPVLAAGAGARQFRTTAPKPSDFAAVPGTSNHGRAPKPEPKPKPKPEPRTKEVGRQVARAHGKTGRRR